MHSKVAPLLGLSKVCATKTSIRHARMRLDIGWFLGFMFFMQEALIWVVLGGIHVAFVVFGFAKHVHYVVKNVRGMRRAFGQPTRVLPPPGEVTLNGIVSSLNDKVPVTVKIRDELDPNTKIQNDRVSRRVKTHSFALLLPEAGTRVTVEPGNDVHLRSLGHMTQWEYSKKTEKSSRFHIGELRDGDRAIVTGVLEEKRVIEPQSSEYRSEKGKVRIEYVLRPIPGIPLSIDSETMLQEISNCMDRIGKIRALGAAVLPFFYGRALVNSFDDWSARYFGGVVVAYAFVYLAHEPLLPFRVPWYDRKVKKIPRTKPKK